MVAPFKVLNTREEAEMELSFIGADPKRFHMYIEKRLDGRFNCLTQKAERHIVEDLEARCVVKRCIVAEFTEYAAVDKPPAKSGEETQGFKARAMLLAGCTDGELMDMLDREFGVGPNRQDYVNWYRCQLRRFGMVPRVITKQGPLV